MLKVEHLSLYHVKDLTPIVDDLSFTLGGGERMALIGEEGNGKSTLLRLIAGDEAVLDYIETSGRITTDRRPGFLPQELPAAERGLTAYEFFCESPVFFDQTPAELGALAARLALGADVFYSEQRMDSFSGGERVKLQLARLLMSQPNLLLLDEPSNDLDAQTVLWLEDFLLTCGLDVLFVSHDEALLTRVATSVLLIERLRHRQLPRAAVWKMGYDEFVSRRASSFAHQEQVARKEREEEREKLRRYEQIRQRVEHEQNAISRGDPAGARLLKKKMHTVLAMGRRFEREHEQMTAMPESEEAIFAKLDCAPLPEGKVVLDLDLPALCVADGEMGDAAAPDRANGGAASTGKDREDDGEAGRVLARNLRMSVRGREKVAIVGRNGVGKSTLLRHIAHALKKRGDLRVFAMPQDPGELLDMDSTPVDMLTVSSDGEERARIRTYLGAMQFTTEEMEHPCAGLSGGQKAKLMFLMMAASGANVLLLDEPTRNLSPLSGPVVRALFAEYPGCIIAVSHDRLFLREVCARTLRLTADGLVEE